MLKIGKVKRHTLNGHCIASKCLGEPQPNRLRPLASLNYFFNNQLMKG